MLGKSFGRVFETMSIVARPVGGVFIVRERDRNPVDFYAHPPVVLVYNMHMH